MTYLEYLREVKERVQLPKPAPENPGACGNICKAAYNVSLQMFRVDEDYFSEHNTASRKYEQVLSERIEEEFRTLGYEGDVRASAYPAVLASVGKLRKYASSAEWQKVRHELLDRIIKEEEAQQ